MKDYVITMITVMQKYLKEMKKILKYNHREKLSKAPFIIISDLECFPEKEQSCQNNSQKSYTQRKAKHKPSGCLHLIMKKIGLIITEEQIVLKSGVKK